MVYKSSFPLMIYALLLVLGIVQQRGNYIHKSQLEIPAERWDSVEWIQGGHSLSWQYLPIHGGTWVLNVGQNGLAVKTDQKKFTYVLDRLSKRIPLELVAYQRLENEQLIPYGLSSDLNTHIIFRSGYKTYSLDIGHRTPAGNDVYIMKDQRIYKADLGFIFKLIEQVEPENFN